MLLGLQTRQQQADVLTHPGPLGEPESTSKDHGEDATTRAYFKHSSARRTNTDAYITAALTKQYPNLEIVVTPAGNVNLLSYATAGNASFEPLQDSTSGLPDSLQLDLYIPPTRRLDGALGGLGEMTLFGKYLYKWKDDDFIVYLIDGRDGQQPYPVVSNYYILTSNKRKAHQLILEAGRWNADLHDEVWVFDGGYWQKSKELYDSIRNATWESVILSSEMKNNIIDDHLSFFNSRETYTHLKVPWKRGIIYYGPPGNGKTISIKAMMRTLYDHEPTPIPTLYVRSLFSYAGPEYSIKQVFGKAREFAPCYLVFEDLDSIINDSVRSYFLNEVDGLKSNDGIFMVGSTNHLERLDPGISKRPSRFDRKYLFPNPDHDERVAYCHFWQKKLADNKEVEFPDRLCPAIAEITDKFSFAYIQEAFVAALLAIARRSKSDKPNPRGLMENLEDDWIGIDTHDDDLENLILWVEIKKQVQVLRDGMREGNRV
ncbi:ATPase [Truncatella angustata]|uniref:ATPase n=1 Tax=Truncatella angustata TaxID=152316 RepID=A0A9P8UM83_9PEZI|nr:ATPase [Truncatella angustata]KAH6654764.1 ATPase [Truncatella angustata]